MTKKKEEEDVDIDKILDEFTEDVTISDGDVIDEVIDEKIVKKINSDLGIDLDEKNSLANKIAQNSLDVIKHGKEVYKGFHSDVLMGRDRSTSSKEMLIKSLEVQNQANKNLIDLAKVLDSKNSGNTNILIGASISAKKSGVDSNNIKSHFKK